MRIERRYETIDPSEEPVIDDALVLEGLDLLFSLIAVLVDLVLFGANERSLVDVGVNLDVRVVGELECILYEK